MCGDDKTGNTVVQRDGGTEGGEIKHRRTPQRGRIFCENSGTAYPWLRSLWTANRMRSGVAGASSAG